MMAFPLASRVPSAVSECQHQDAHPPLAVAQKRRSGRKI